MREENKVVEKDVTSQGGAQGPSTGVAPKEEPKKERGMLFYYGMMFLVYFVGMNIASFFKVFDPIINYMIPNENITLRFFLSSKHLNYEDLESSNDYVHEIETKYDVAGDLSPEIVNIEYDLLVLDDEAKISKQNLFMYCIAKLSAKREAEVKKAFGRYIDFPRKGLFFSKLPIIKYNKDMKRRKMSLSNDEFTTFDEPTADEPGTEKYTEQKQKSNLFYKPEVSLYVLTSASQIEAATLHEFNFINVDVRFNPLTKEFIPPLSLTDFWLMQKEYKELEHGKSNKLNIKVDFRFSGFTKFKYIRSIEKNDEVMTQNFQMDSTKDLIVEILKTNSTHYLILLFTVQTLHILFSFLGFASDISYHKKLDRLDGLYTKIYFIRLFHYFIAVIYYYIEDVSKIIYFELIISLAIELWKFKKIFRTEVDFKFPFIHFHNRIKYEESTSTSLEEDAIKLTVKTVFLPLALFYLGYRVYYYNNYIFAHPFKFIIEYFFFLLNIFGFALMTPQIYINYKMKSVEHMPFKALSYKFLNTIIDDVFAFALETPTLHRISVFKDDIIFVIFIVQLYLYRNNKRIHSEPVEAGNSNEKTILSEDPKQLSEEKVNEQASDTQQQDLKTPEQTLNDKKNN